MVRCVTIESDRDDHHGHTEVVWRGFDARERAHRSAMVALAGPVAELLETLAPEADAPDPEVLRSWRGDWDESEECLRLVAPHSAERAALRRSMLRELCAFLSDPGVRERLARVVDALHAHVTLDETLLDDALG